MFSQFRNAVEKLAQEPIRVVTEATASSDHSSAAEPTAHARAGSLDARSSSPLSSTELAGSALSNLRKSLAAQRSASISSVPTTSSTTSTNNSKTPSPAPQEGANTRPARKSNLEERLRRATYAIGDASSSAASSTKSTRPSSPSPMSANRRPMPTKAQEKTVTSSSDDAPRMSTDSKLSLSESKLKNEVNSDALGKEEVAADDQFDDPLHASPRVKSPQPTAVSSKPQTTDDAPKEEAASSIADSLIPASTSTESPNVSISTGLEASATETEAPLSTTDEPPSKEEAKEEEGESQAQPEAPFEGKDDTKEQEKSSSGNDQAVQDSSPASPDANLSASDASLPADEKEPVSEVVDQPAVSAKLEETPASITESTENIPSEVATEESSEAPSPSLSEDSKPQEEQSPAPERPTTEEPTATSPPSELSSSPAPVSTSSSSNAAEVESLQARLKQVEQRFADVSTSFKRLQAEKLAADAVLRDVSPLDGIKDADALRDFFKEIQVKDKVFQDEIKRLNQKLELQEDRIEEMRDTHRLESHSRSDEVKKIRTQLEETEKLFEAAQRATSNVEDVSAKRQQEIDDLKKEVEKAKTSAKEEEEKRVKAISLLKTVRQKLVKAEKDKDDATRELVAVKEREKGDKDKENAEKRSHQQEVDALNSAHEKSVAGLKAQFNKDMAGLRERYEQELSALRGQSSLELASAKSVHAKELDTKLSQIKTLENSLNNVARDKNSFFDQLQLRQAELESAQAHLESLQHQNTELQFQLREANDRIALLKEEASELLREQHNRSTRDPAASAEEIGRQVAAAEAKYEARLTEVRRNLTVMEKERYESEADWSRKLKEKVKELEEIKRVLGSATRSREADENVVAKLKADLKEAVERVRVLDRQVAELPGLREQILELEKMSKDQDQESSVKIHVLEKQIEELKNREVQMKQSNKTLRDELRKVQSSAALLERQRNPGVGYWTTRVSSDNNGLASPVPRSPAPPSPVVPESTTSRSSSPAPSSPAPSQKNSDEEVNLEYLRNVILQFLEHKEMRPNLVKVLSIILHFTPQETRRLIARV